MNVHYLLWIGIIFVVISIFIVIFSSLFLMAQKTDTKTEVKGGAIIFIGPVPIAFGTDKNSVIFLSVLMFVLMLLAYFLFFSKVRF